VNWFLVRLKHRISSVLVAMIQGMKNRAGQSLLKMHIEIEEWKTF
jgi:hypothetical protein